MHNELSLKDLVHCVLVQATFGPKKEESMKKNKEIIIENIRVVYGTLQKHGELLTTEDIKDLSNKLEKSERQVRKYITIIKKHGFGKVIESIRQGESINSLYKSAMGHKTEIVRATKLLQREYDITVNELRAFLKPYRKLKEEEVINFGEKEEEKQEQEWWKE